MQPCDEWAIALERERHGDLDASEAARLKEHLAGCAACSAARAEAGLLEQALAVPEPSTTGWSDLETRLRNAQRAYRGDARRGALAMVVFLPLFWLVRGFAMGRFFDDFGSGLLVGGAIGLAIFGAQLAWVRARKRRLSSQGDLFEELRRRYRKRLFILRWISPFVPLAAFALVPLRHLLGRGHLWIGVVLAAAAGFEILSLYRARVLVPRLKRELAELEGGA
jgi:hypothetical protein